MGADLATLPLALEFTYNWKVPREVYCQTGDEDQKHDE